MSDIVTDLRQTPIPFPECEAERPPRKTAEDDWTKILGGQGLAVCGMSNAAVNLYHEHIYALLFYANRGYRIRLTGHSLGGGVAALLGVLVQRDLMQAKSAQADLGKEEETEQNAPLKVYAYGTPSCVDRKLAELLEPVVTTVVLHDDVVPRLTPTSCRGLLKHLLHIRETWVKEHLPDDIMAIKDRAKSAWAPRWRGSFTLPSSSSSIKRYCRKHIQYGKKKLLSVREKIIGDERGRLVSIAEDSGAEETLSQSTIDETSGSQSGEEKPQHLVLDYIGGLDATTTGVVIDGDEFFDPGRSLIDENDAESFNDAYEHEVSEKEDTPSSGSDSSDFDGTSESESSMNMEGPDEKEAPGAVLLEETPLPRMFLPGKIVHVYSHRGVYKAAYVPRDFRELRRISLAGNMLSDHKSKPYYEALLEVRTVRQASEAPPRWTAFDEDDTW